MKQKRIGPPQLRYWKGIEKLCRLLMIFNKSTLVVSASTYLNAYMCYGDTVTTKTHLISLSSNFDYDLKSKVIDIFKKFDKYWDSEK